MNRIKCIKSIYYAQNHQWNKFRKVTYNRLHKFEVLYDAQCMSLSTDSDDYQYLQKSIVPTLHFQKSLPRLPIPELDKTCSRYLDSLKPLVGPEQFQKTKSIVNTFKETDGKKLHEELTTHDKSNKHTSYISAYWFDMYLRDRQPIVINYNPFLAFVDDPRPGYNDQLIRATNMLISSLRLMKSLRKGILEPEVFHLNPAKSNTQLFRQVTRFLPSSLSWYGAYMFNAYPLDMSQYRSLFNATRIPEIGKDRLFRVDSAKHILIIKNGNFFAFDVLDKNGNILSPECIFSCMKQVVEDISPPSDYPVGYFTAENRDRWANARTVLLKCGNEHNLRTIDTALFVLVLDDTVVADDPDKVFRTFLHGDASNRWFDKSFQLIITKDGKAAVNMEHAWGDGVAVLRFCNEIVQDSAAHGWIHPNSEMGKTDAVPPVQKLSFSLDDGLKKMLNDAKEHYKNIVSPLAVNYKVISRCNKQYCKDQKISPDGLMQLIFQLAYYRLTGKTVATYESCSTSAFRHGRTETIRPATMETQACSKAFHSNPKPEIKVLKELVMKCSKKHNELTKNAAMGQGFDRHLFALRKLAEAHKTTPEIFTDSSYALINHNILSTSTLSSPQIVMGGFGPVVKDGLGVGYVISDFLTGCVTTSYKNHQDGSGFIECFNSCLNDVCNVLEEKKIN